MLEECLKCVNCETRDLPADYGKRSNFVKIIPRRNVQKQAFHLKPIRSRLLELRWFISILFHLAIVVCTTQRQSTPSRVIRTFQLIYLGSPSVRRAIPVIYDNMTERYSMHPWHHSSEQCALVGYTKKRARGRSGSGTLSSTLSGLYPDCK